MTPGFGTTVSKAYAFEEGPIWEKKADLEYWAPAASRVEQKTSFIYMDVGLWAGDGPSDARHHERRRDFGIVCGDLAVLCAYDKSHRPSINLPRSDYADSLRWVMKQLEAPDPLGAPRICAVKQAHINTELENARRQQWQHSPHRVHLFIGDLHAPVIAKRDATQRGAMPADGRLFLDTSALGGTVIEKIVRAWLCVAFETARSVSPLSDALMKRWHLTDRSIIGEVIGLVRRIRGLPPRHEAPIHDILRSCFTELEQNGLLVSPTEAQLRRWRDMYLGSGTQKGADISESSLSDLRLWLDLVAKAMERGPQQKQPVDVRLVQLGDMYELWVGLQCGFKPGGSYWDRVPQFSEAWIRQARSVEGCGDAIGRLEDLASKEPSRVKLLAGNHDGYVMALPRSMGRSASYSDRDAGVFAEHGHNSDGFNNDKGAWEGWALTQATFLAPAVRSLEPPLAKLLGVLRGSGGARFARISHATELRCRAGDFQFYVMGHTHIPFIRRITIFRLPS